MFKQWKVTLKYSGFSGEFTVEAEDEQEAARQAYDLYLEMKEKENGNQQ